MEQVGIDITCDLAGFRRELARIPNIEPGEVKRLVEELTRSIKVAERAAKQVVKVQPAPYVRVPGGLLSLALLDYSAG